MFDEGGESIWVWQTLVAYPIPILPFSLRQLTTEANWKTAFPQPPLQMAMVEDILRGDTGQSLWKSIFCPTSPLLIPATCIVV